MEIRAGKTDTAKDGVGERKASNHALLGTVSSSVNVGEIRCSSAIAGYALHTDCKVEQTVSLKMTSINEQKNEIEIIPHFCVCESHISQLLTVADDLLVRTQCPS